MIEGQRLVEKSIVQIDHPKKRFDETFSPKKVAKAIGVSESSLKRWCDAGFLVASKTAGGHRRITRAEVVSFVKRRKLEFPNPEMIGLPSLNDISIQNVLDGITQLRDALIHADEQLCQRLLTYLFLNGREMSEIFDLFVAPAFARIGEEWSHGSVEVFEERQACQTCVAAFHEIRTLLPAPGDSALTAIGGGIEHDFYSLPTASVELTLASLGWAARSLGSNLPLNTLLQAAIQQEPDVLWLSVSYLPERSHVAAEINGLAARLPAKTTLIVGGNAMDTSLRTQLKNAICCDNFSQLVTCVRNLKQVSGENLPR